jgi:argininosuccinate lyase
MKLWQKDQSLDDRIEIFTVGRDREMDLRLSRLDMLGSIAHGQMLSEIGLISKEEFTQIRQVLQELIAQVEAGQFSIEPGVEDIHSQVELLLTRKLGDTGKKIHAARSRNDQVLLDLRLFFREETAHIVRTTQEIIEQLLLLSEKHKGDLLPGYTHLQVAMVSSFGLWFGAYAETLIDDLRLWTGIYQSINQNPLGSAAGYGSSFPIDRHTTTKLLGFEDLAYNVVHAQMGRGKSEMFMAFGIAALGQTLGKLAMDVCLYNSQNFGFIRLPDAFTTGSSIMPHKKNPDLFELLRARCNQLQSLPAQLGITLANLPSGYHRDYQLLKEIIFPALDSLKECQSILLYALPQLHVNNNLLQDEKYDLLFTVEAVNESVEKGMPFRDAYRHIAAQVTEGAFKPSGEIHHTHAGSLGNLCNGDIKRKLDKVLEQFTFDTWESCLKSLAGKE